MYILLLLFWILLNGRVTVEILLFGLAIAAAVWLFMWKFMDYSPKKEWMLLKSTGVLILFVGTLLKEIIIANINVIKISLSPKLVPEPAMVYFHSSLKSGFARVLLANAITLTPGTITVSLTGDEYCVHCLDKSYADGIESSDFVQLLERMEACWQ